MERIPAALASATMESALKRVGLNFWASAAYSSLGIGAKATAYYFGCQLYQSLRVPIGLIDSSRGGSMIKSWMSSESLKMFPEISQAHLVTNSEVEKPQHVASMFYNGMLAPLRSMTFKGIIWYQGESDRLNPTQYAKLFPAFVEQLRQLFGEQLPFYYAQIAPFSYVDRKQPLAGALLREVQLNCEKMIPHAGMAVLTDIGDEHCIHPGNKRDVGKRLAYLALSDTYGKRGIAAHSPCYNSKVVEGNRMILTFENAEMGLTTYNKKLMYFEIAGKEKKYLPAEARIIEKNKVEVWNDDICEPVSVRYAFRNFVRGDLFGVNGLPVSSFRTDMFVSE